MRISPLRMLFLALMPSVALVLGAVPSWFLFRQWQGDVGIYARYAQRLFQGEVPFRDFTVEYPPLALLAFLLPQLAAFGRTIGTQTYAFLLLGENALFCVATTAAMLHVALAIGVRPRFVVSTLAGLAFLLSPVLPWRFDMFPAMLTALGLFAMVRRRPLAAGWWLGAGVAAKLYPAVLGPVVLLQLALARRWRAFGELIAGGALALALTVLPVYVLAGSTLWVFLTYHAQRGIQIESVAGGIIGLGAKLGLTQATIVFNFGALHFVSPWADTMLPVLTPMFVALYIGVLFVAYNCFRANAGDKRSLIALWSAALLAFIITNKVFSPQYLVWLFPFVPFLSRRQIGLFAAICVATVIIFPFQYQAMLALDLWAVLLLNLRNAATIVLCVWILAATWRDSTSKKMTTNHQDAKIREQVL